MRWLDRRPEVAIVGVLLLASALRLQHVDQPYVDAYAWREADTASIADAFAAGAWNVFLPQVRWGGRGPNYIGAEFQTVSYLAALAYRAFGPAAWVGRSVSIAFGLLGVFALHGLVRRAWDRPRAVASAAVMAVLPGAVFTERSFLPDGAMTALMTTSLWMLVAYGQTERRRYLVVAAVTGMLGCLTKLPGGILVIVAAYVVRATLGARLRDRRVRAQLATAAAVVVFPVIAYYAWARHLALSTPPYHFTGEGKFVWDGGVRAWIEKGYFLPQLWRIVSSEDHLWGLPFIALAAAGLWLAGAEVRPRAAHWVFHAWLVAMAARFLIEADHLVSDPYNLHLFHPVVAAFAGHALVTLARRGGLLPSGLRLAASAVLFAGAATFGLAKSRHLFAEAFRDHLVVGRIVAGASCPDELVISFGTDPVALYHSRRNGWLFPPYEALSAWDYGPRDISLLRELRSRGGRWLVIPSMNEYTRGSGLEFLRVHYPALHAEIRDTFDVVREIPEGLVLRARS